ncbi:GTP-binding protein [Parasphaerochaeta coccoides]|uniref:Cobalamin synthesis protein P47K n=1 Tax=Parasphaerochaeta coccoides (strain ATCC BAA-1237 / DSM 17374 / SPN1) TaxID=760011 RepID=F4GJR9_PARC1|nr:GTP-binding protein [Parasphaerochaeta coccoides]AEC02816.1 cobalamin synthesis protein P47K [Parasphaerochaeta coccoides DSM 17374]
MKILIISGFLGAGKTTFIKSMVKKTGRQFVVVENEFGDVSVDGPLLSAREQQEAQPPTIWELTEGCICCSMKLDFSNSVMTIANSLNPDYLIVEPSGVAFLGPILDNLKKICYGEAIQLLKPVTLVDYQHYKNSMVDYKDCITDQASHAGWVLLSKSESCHKDVFTEFASEVHAWNPASSVPDCHYEMLPRSWWKALLETPLDPSSVEPAPQVNEDRRPKLQQISFTDVKIPDIPTLVSILGRLTSLIEGKIIRAKGFFPMGDEWIRFDVVENTYEIRATDVMDDSRMILIGRGLNVQQLEDMWNATAVVAEEDEDETT